VRPRRRPPGDPNDPQARDAGKGRGVGAWDQPATGRGPTRPTQVVRHRPYDPFRQQHAAFAVTRVRSFRLGGIRTARYLVRAVSAGQDHMRLDRIL